MLLELLKDRVHDVDRDIFEPGNGLGDLLNLIVGEVLYDLAGDFLVERHHHERYLLW